MFTIHGPSHTHHHTTRLANTTTSQHPRPLVPPWTPWTRFVPRWPRGGGPLQWSRKQHQGRPGHQTAILSFVTNIRTTTGPTPRTLVWYWSSTLRLVEYSFHSARLSAQSINPLHPLVQKRSRSGSLPRDGAEALPAPR